MEGKEGKEREDIREEFNLAVTLAFDNEHGMEFGQLALIKALVDLERENNPDATESQLLGRVIGRTVMQYYDGYKGQIWVDKIQDKGIGAAQEAYGFEKDEPFSKGFSEDKIPVSKSIFPTGNEPT